MHGHGVALGDSVTASALLARGMLVAPFSLSVPAVDDFYVVCRNEMQLDADRAGVHRLAVCREGRRPTAAPTRRSPASISIRKRPQLKVIGAKTAG